jgi:hypothetical protein
MLQRITSKVTSEINTVWINARRKGALPDVVQVRADEARVVKIASAPSERSPRLQREQIDVRIALTEFREVARVDASCAALSRTASAEIASDAASPVVAASCRPSVSKTASAGQALAMAELVDQVLQLGRVAGAHALTRPPPCRLSANKAERRRSSSSCATRSLRTWKKAEPIAHRGHDRDERNDQPQGDSHGVDAGCHLRRGLVLHRSEEIARPNELDVRALHAKCAAPLQSFARGAYDRAPCGPPAPHVRSSTSGAGGTKPRAARVTRLGRLGRGARDPVPVAREPCRAGSRSPSCGPTSSTR